MIFESEIDLCLRVEHPWAAKARPPIQGFEGGLVHLKISLITGQWLDFDSASKEYTIS